MDVQEARGALRAAVLAEVAGQRRQVLSTPVALGARQLAEHVVRERPQFGQVGHLQQQPVNAQVFEGGDAASPAEAAQRLQRPVRLFVRPGDLPRVPARPADPDDRLRVREKLSQPADAGGPEPARVRAARMLPVGGGRHQHHFRLPRRDDRVRRAGGEEMLDDVPDPLPQGLRVLRATRRRHIESDRHDVVAARGVVAEVRGPAPCLAVVPPASQQQAFNKVVAHPPGGRRDHVFPAEYHPADRGRMLGDEEAHVLFRVLLGRIHGDQVGRHLVAHQDGGDDDRGHPADTRQPERPVTLP